MSEEIETNKSRVETRFKILDESSFADGDGNIISEESQDKAMAGISGFVKILEEQLKEVEDIIGDMKVSYVSPDNFESLFKLQKNFEQTQENYEKLRALVDKYHLLYYTIEWLSEDDPLYDFHNKMSKI